MVWGRGIIVLAVAILPILGVGDAALSWKCQPLKDNKMRPRIAETAKNAVAYSMSCQPARWRLFAGCSR